MNTWFLTLLCKKFMQPQTLLFASLLIICGVPVMNISPVMAQTVETTSVSSTQLGKVARELRRNQRRWYADNLKNYRYTLQISCFCTSETREPVEIEVRNGKLKSISRPKGGAPVDLNTFERYSTIPKLFNVIQKAIAAQADEISVKYNPQYGYPTNIYINPETMIADEEIWLTISNFQVIPSSYPILRWNQ